MFGNATQPLTRGHRIGVALFVLLLVGLGALVEARQALMQRRMCDLNVFLRAAWAVRNDADLYAITDDNDWHYIYPPLYAILMTPLADPPKGADTAGYVPFAVSSAICYCLNLLCLLLGVHVLASALEERAADATMRTQPRFCQRWWALRLWPICICFLPIGHTMMRGQVNAIVLASICAAMAGWIQQKRFQAGFWLSLAICIKIIPAFLLVYPAWKRDFRALVGCLTGCVIGLVLIPLLAFGPARMATHYETYARVFFGPLFKVTDDDRNKEEILGVNATDSVGVKDALHNWTYPHHGNRPEDMHVAAKTAYILLGITMTLLTLWPGGRSGSDWTTRCAHQLAGLTLLMTIFSPVCHSHYLLFCLPIIMSLLANTWQYQATIAVPRGMLFCFVAFGLTMGIAYLPGLEILKDRCASLFAVLPLWVIPITQLWRGMAPVPVPAGRQEAHMAA
jgi:hypothetical protein